MGGTDPWTYRGKIARSSNQAGISYCFVNVGSDHPSIFEAFLKGQTERPGKFPKMITCPNEVCKQAPALRR